MARYPQATIDRIKSEVDLAALVRAKGVELKPHGKDLIGLCPFHDDHDPSLVVTPAKNLWHCLGACQQGGSVIDWVIKAEGLSFRHAVELLQADPTAAVKAGPVQKQSTVPRLPSPFERDVDDEALLNQVVDYYHQTLKQSPEAKAYLERRGLGSSELLEHFSLGFCNRTLGYRLPAKNRAAGAAIRGRLQALGVLRESGHEHFRGSLMVPVVDNKGQVLELYGRKINGNLRKGTPSHLYLPGPHRGVFNRQALQASDDVILCESLIDALTFWTAGFRNVTTSYGVEGFTPEILAAFKAEDVKRIFIAYDRDAAGDKAALKLAETLQTEGFECFRLKFPKGMDANEYAQQVKPAAKSLGLLLRNAEWIGKGQAPEAKPSFLAALSEAKTTPSDDDKHAPEPIAKAQPEAGPKPPAQTAGAGLTWSGEDLVTHFGPRRWRIRGFRKNQSYDQLKVNVLVATTGDEQKFHVDSFDLYSAKHRGLFIKQAAGELSLEERVLKYDLGKLLLQLEELQDQQIQDTLKPKTPEVELADDEKAAAFELLKSPDLMDRILSDFEACGVVGEQTNKLVGYLATVSRKLDEPLAIIVQSSSAAGKSSLMESILAFVPPEDRTKYSAMTGQSLFYMGESDLKHKILAIVEEEGAERASYALKLLQSEGELTIASTGKDPQTGRMETQEYRVEGPVMIFLTTTAIEIDEELLNRCIVLTVDEDREQTRKIHQLQRQRKTLKGLLANQDRELVRKRHQNAQRLLRPLLVANPFAEKLTFLDDRTRTRRDHMKYLTLIQSIALLHQYQRPVQRIRHQGREVEYIEVTPEDIATANRLAHQVLGRSLDELPPQTRRMLNLLDDMAIKVCKEHDLERSAFRFSRRQVREFCGWTEFQVRTHMNKLMELEYVIPYRGKRGQSFVYELLYDGGGQDGELFLSGLVDASGLPQAYDEKFEHLNSKFEHQKAEFEEGSSPQRAPNEIANNEAKLNKSDNLTAKFESVPKSTRGPKNGKTYILKSHTLNSSSSLAAKSC